MIVNNHIETEQDLRQIAGMLLLNGTLTVCPGLAQGKTGIAVFFFHYARYTGNPLFTDYALDLLGEMQNQIHAYSPADYEKGIAGIGVGIDYLIRHGFLDAEEDLFEDFDQRMVRAVRYDPWPDFSLYDGLTGYGRYWISRLRRQPLYGQAQECVNCIVEQIERSSPDIPPEEQTDIYCFLHELREISGVDIPAGLLEHYREQSSNIHRDFPRLGDSPVGNAIRMYQRSLYFDEALEEDRIFTQIPNLDREKPPAGTGLLTGYAGEGLLRLTALDPTISSWTSLL